MRVAAQIVDPSHFDSYCSNTQCSAPSEKNVWDRLNGKTICRECIEDALYGEGDTRKLKTREATCDACQKTMGTVRCETLVQHDGGLYVVALALCQHDLRCFLARALPPEHVLALRSQYRELFRGKPTHPDDLGIYVLHEYYYGPDGRMKQPLMSIEPPPATRQQDNVRGPVLKRLKEFLRSFF